MRHTIHLLLLSFVLTFSSIAHADLAELIEAIVDLEGYLERKMKNEMKKVEQQHKNDEDPNNNNNGACDRNEATTSNSGGSGNSGAGGGNNDDDKDYGDNKCGSDLSNTKSGANVLKGQSETFIQGQVQRQQNANYIPNQLEILSQLQATIDTEAKRQAIQDKARAAQEAEDRKKAEEAKKRLEDNLDKLNDKEKKKIKDLLDKFDKSKQNIGPGFKKDGITPATTTNPTQSTFENEKYPINVVDIAKTTLKGLFQCLDYEVIGLCIYINYVPPLEIEIVPVLKISHLNPEFVVTAHDRSGKTPWKLMANTAGTIAETLQSKIMPVVFDSPTISSGSRALAINKATRFKEVNVFGHPLANVLEQIKIGKVGLFCESKIDIFKPYFMSEIDSFAWRSPMLTLVAEATQNGATVLAPGYRELNQKDDAFFTINAWKTWGALFPRTGYALQQQPGKAAALTVQRAIDIVLHKKHLPHIAFYQDPETDYKTKVLNLSNPEKTKAWQMIKPVEKKRCESFGKYGNFTDRDDWGDDLPEQSVAENENEVGERVESYSWNNWTPYKCCMPHPGWVLLSFEW